MTTKMEGLQHKAGLNKSSSTPNVKGKRAVKSEDNNKRVYSQLQSKANARNIKNNHHFLTETFKGCHLSSPTGKPFWI